MSSSILGGCSPEKMQFRTMTPCWFITRSCMMNLTLSFMLGDELAIGFPKRDVSNEQVEVSHIQKGSDHVRCMW